MKTQDKDIDKIIYAATDAILAQLEKNKDDLAQAIVLCNGELHVSIGIKATVDGAVTSITSKVSFVKEKVTDEKKWTISNQEALPFADQTAGGVATDEAAEAITVRDIRGRKGK